MNLYKRMLASGLLTCITISSVRIPSLAVNFNETIQRIQTQCTELKSSYPQNENILKLEKILRDCEKEINEYLAVVSIALDAESTAKTLEEAENLIQDYIKMANKCIRNGVRGKKRYISEIKYLNEVLKYRSDSNQVLIEKMQTLLEEIQEEEEEKGIDQHNVNQQIKNVLEESTNGFQNLQVSLNKNLMKTIYLLNKSRKALCNKNLDLKKYKLEIPEEANIIDVSNDKIHFGKNSMEDNRTDDPVFEEIPCCTNIKQGDIGDCYFLSSLAALVQFRPQSILESIVDNDDGTVTVRFYDNDNKACYYKISKSLSEYEGSVDSDLWVRLFEKAYVFHCTKLKKGLDSRSTKKVDYEIIHGAFRTHQAMAHLCGNSNHGVVESRCKKKYLPFIEEKYFQGNSVGEYSDEAIKFFNKINEKVDQHQIMSVTSKKAIPCEEGIRSSHAYSIIGTRDTNSKTGKPCKLILLRNPWGNSVPCYKKESDGSYILKKFVQDRDGIFAIDLNDFLSIFTTLHYCTVK